MMISKETAKKIFKFIQRDFSLQTKWNPPESDDVEFVKMNADKIGLIPY